MDRVYIEYEVTYKIYTEYVTATRKKPANMLELFNKLVKKHSHRSDLQGLKIIVCNQITTK